MSEDAPALAEGLDTAAFTAAVAEELGKRIEGVTMQVSADLELRAEAGEELELVYALDELWEAYGGGELTAGDLDEVAEGLADALSGAEDGEGEDFPGEVDDLVALVMPEATLEMASDVPLICVPLVADLLIAFAWVEDGEVAFLTDEDAEELDIDIEALFKPAVTRTLEALPEPEVEDVGEVYRIDMGGGIEASSLLDMGFWEGLCEEHGGALLVTVPDRDVVLFLKESEGTRDQLQAAANVVLEDSEEASWAILRIAPGEEWSELEPEAEAEAGA